MAKNILKVRDDYEPIFFKTIEKDGSKQTYKLEEGSSANWLQEDSFTISELRGRIEPWLTSLFQSEHLSLLVGSGLTTAVQKASVESTSNCMEIPILTSKYSDKIKKAAQESASKTERGEANIEDYIRIINNLLKGLEILEDEDEFTSLKDDLNKILDEFLFNISKIENDIVMAEDTERTEAFNMLAMFLMSFASRTGIRDRLNIFTTNYDRVLEAGAELAGLHLLDRFIGTLAPIFRSSRLDLDMHYNPPGIRGEPRYLEGVARYTKLHGSIDWVETRNEIRKIGLPFGVTNIDPYILAPGLGCSDKTRIMIYPNSSKDRETAEYPYVELFRDFAAALCRPNSTIVTYGYSFGDDHINRIIRDMLTIPSTHLVIISYDDETGRIMKCYDKIGRPSQISLLIGPDLADLNCLTKHFLPKPSIDRTTIRMSELLKQRYNEQTEKNVSTVQLENRGGVIE